MAKRRRRHRHVAPGAPPGTLVAPPDAHATQIRVIGYGGDRHEEIEITDLEDIRVLRARHAVIWVDVTGIADTARLRGLAEIFDLHALALEDVVSGHQRVKLERHRGHLFFVLHMAESDEDLGTEQLSLFVGHGFVVTIREEWDAPLAPVRKRTANPAGHMRHAGADYLAYAILDSVVDHYFPVLDILSERLDALEERVVARPTPAAVGEIQRNRRELMSLRRAMSPLRDMLNELLRGETEGLFRPDTLVYLRDVHDHVLRVVELVETYRELASTLMDLYLSSISNRMNEIMKVLTIIATIFIPLSFVASIYGMNFDTTKPFNMPELGWSYGYPFALCLMAAVAASLLLFFRYRGWLGGPRARDNPGPPAGRSEP